MNAVMKRGRRLGWRRGAWGIAALLLLGGTGCSLDSLLKNDELPEDVSDPSATESPSGALAAYYATLSYFRTAFGVDDKFVEAVGALTDELQSRGASLAPFDRRALPETETDYANNYSNLNRVRGQAGQAIGLLTDYLPDQPALASHLYAVLGYAEIFLAELYCSGIPLSTVDYNGDFTLRPGSTTEEVLIHATALFDTALALAGDSTQFEQLARLGQARARLGLGTYTAAAAAVAGVPDDYRYEVSYTNIFTPDSTRRSNFARTSPSNSNLWFNRTIPNVEGGNGLDWRTSDDPRTRVTQRGSSTELGPHYHPDKYDTAGSSPIVLASGVEARLIEAEADLQAGGSTWLTTLNALRTDGTFSVDTQVVSVDEMVDPPDTTFAYDTLWNAGSGGYDGLAPLADPGTAEGRVDLLFRERGFWLFLTGQRQGDLRRLIRQYGRLESQVYPVGTHGPSGLPYGGDVTVPIPTTEFANPLYTGCFSRGA